MSRRRKPAALVASALAGCAGTKPVVPEQNQVDPARDGPAVAAVRALARDALHHDHYARRVLYTWTDAGQAAALANAKQPLLSRHESPTSGASYLDQIMFVLAKLGDPVAQVLYTEAFARMRFAWHAPWATRGGWPSGEQYGDTLIRVTLKPDSIIVAISTSKGVVGAKNLLDETVPLADAVARPEKIAAIYFASEQHVDHRPGFPKPTATFREFALCNESMIESFEVGTPAIAKRLEEDMALLSTLAKYADGIPEVRTAPLTTWNHAVPAPSPEVAFAAALALYNENYALDRRRIANLMLLLGQVKPSPAIARASTATFAPGGVRNPPRVVKGNPLESFARPLNPTAAKP